MSYNFKEKIEELGSLLVTIFFDAILVLSVSLVTYAVKWCIEHCYGQSIKEIDNAAVYYIYNISKYLLISSFSLFALLDIAIQLKSMIKRLRYE